MPQINNSHWMFFTIQYMLVFFLIFLVLSFYSSNSNRTMFHANKYKVALYRFESVA